MQRCSSCCSSCCCSCCPCAELSIAAYIRGHYQKHDLRDAAAHGDAKAVRRFLECGISPNAVAIAGRDVEVGPLHVASLNGHAEVMLLLLQHDADPKASLSNKQTPLHYAAINGHPECIRILLDADADVNAEGQSKWTPLYMTSFKNGAWGESRAMLKGAGGKSAIPV